MTRYTLILIITYTLALLVAIVASTVEAQITIITEPSKVRPPAGSLLDPPPTDVPRPAVVLTSWQACPTGYCFEYSNGTKINETFAEYYVRTGKRPPETRRTCATGYCGTFSSYPTVATGGCPCGCKAGSCNCHHSKNAGKPLADQKYEPRPRSLEDRLTRAAKRANALVQTYQQPSTATQNLNRLRSQIQWR